MTTGPILEGLNLVARDIDATLDFYRALGVSIPADAVWRTDTGGHHAKADLAGGADFEIDSEALARVYNAGYEGSGVATVIGFRVDSRGAVDNIHARLTAAGYRDVQKPYDAFWGSRYAIIEDPDGRHVGVMSPVDEQNRSAPPSV